MNLISYLFNHIFTYPIFNVLMLLYHLFGDFGLSIIVLTIVIFIVLFPLTRRQFKAMKAMLVLGPELAEIRKQYAQDLRAQREATKALYKQHGVSPPSTFLSLLVQAPIFGGLFLALNTVLNHATLTNLNHIIYPFLPQLTSVPNIDLNWFTIFNSALHFSLGMPDPTPEQQISSSSALTVHRGRYAVAARVVTRKRGPYASAMPFKPLR